MLVLGVLRDLFTRPNRMSGIEDESVDAFLSRRFGPKFARIFGSALVHGIYAADSRILSVRAAFPTIWDAHLRGAGSVSRSMFNRRKINNDSTPKQEYTLGGIIGFMKDTSVFSFKGGVSELTARLLEFLKNAPNVQIIQESVSSLTMNGIAGDFSVCIRVSNRRFVA